MNLENKLRNKILNNDVINISDLYPYSKIKLNRKRQRKKFNKNYSIYISDGIFEIYHASLLFACMFNFSKKSTTLDLVKIDSLSDVKPTLYYLDYTYNDQNGK